jgi:hypothetical protein
MVGSAKTAMRHPKFARIPKGGPLLWVIQNKLRVTLGQRISFERYVDYASVHKDPDVLLRPSFLGQSFKRKIELKDEPHYTDTFFNV